MTQYHIENKRQTITLHDSAMDGLAQREIAILKMRLDGKSQEEIRLALGISLSRVSQIEIALIDRLVENGLASITFDSFPEGIKGKRGPVRGPCRHCGEMYRSYGAKIYCSLKCLHQSDEFKNRMISQNEIINRRRRELAGAENPDSNVVVLICQNCDQEFSVPFKLRGKQNCSKQCQREWFASRFDRWFANPISLALPQCYDEFLSSESLPCLVEGCDWEGQHLSNHMNHVHGITQEKIKEMAGFNRGTGLVTTKLSRVLSEKSIVQGLSDFANKVQFIDHNGAYRQSCDVRLEAREHIQKSRIILQERKSNGEVSGEKTICPQCGNDVVQPIDGKAIYCSIACRDQWYQRKVFKVVCAQCQREFNGTSAQKKRSDLGLPVCCKATCRNARNMTICHEKMAKEKHP